MFVQTLNNLSSSASAVEILLSTSELEATNQDSTMKSLGSRLIAVDTTDATHVFNIDLGNNADVDNNPTNGGSHHVNPTKVGIQTVPSSFNGKNIYLRRYEWSGAGFNGNCESGSCSDCPSCASTCDIINYGYGRLSALRFTPGAVLCTADVAPSGGNGTVNVDDLLAVINGWGLSNVAGDVTDNGIVDVDDLLAVINCWGPCNCPPLAPPSSISDCFNTYCAGLSGQDWQDCINKCMEAVCQQYPSQCD